MPKELKLSEDSANEIPIPEQSLGDFRVEIRDIQENHSTGDLKLIDADLLVPEDELFWQRVKDFEAGSADLSREEFDVYHKGATFSGNKSRKHFGAFLANRLFIARLKREV